MEVQARWAEWAGGKFVQETELHTLPARLTPKQLHVTLPSGLVLKFKRFDRVGRPLKAWRSYYGGNTQPRKYIDIAPVAKEAQ
jgi:hypothetical protein